METQNQKTPTAIPPRTSTITLSKFTPWASLLILALVGFVSIRALIKTPDIVYSRDRITEIRDDSVQHWKDIAGREHGEKLIAQADAKTLREVYPFMDSVLRVLKVQGDKIDAIAAVGITTSGTMKGKTDTVVIDQKKVPRFTFHDDFLKLQGVLTDPPMIDYSIKDSLIVTTYRKRAWFLGRERTYIDAYSLNPNSHITGLNGLQVSSDRARRFGLGPYIGYGFNGYQLRPSIGLSLQYSLIRF